MRTIWAAVGVVMVVSACGTTQSGSPASTSPATATSPAAGAAGSTEPAAPAGPTLDITIAGGTVTPTNAQLDAAVGQPITLTVTSDAADELHVHAVPEASFEVQPGADQTFEFTVDVPGRVEVELHELHRTVVTVQVRP